MRAHAWRDAGSVISNDVPSPSLDRTVTAPPWATAIVIDGKRFVRKAEEKAAAAHR